VAGALFTATQQRVLGLLFGQPDRSFFANEVIALARVGNGSVQRELARLVASGLVVSSVVGRQRHYRANRESPIFDELRSIMMKTVGAAEPAREALQGLARKISCAFIYGSIAKGTDSATSDMDVLIVSDELTLEEVFDALEPAEASLGRKVNPTLLRTAEFEAARHVPDSFVARVLAGPTIALIGP
jgi:predicted nucleotidyltransferase